MLDNFFGEENQSNPNPQKRENYSKTCADEADMPPIPRRRFAGLKNQVI